MEQDPRLEREHELVVETVIASMEGDLDRAADAQEELEDVQMDTLPPEGKWRIKMGKPREVPEYEIECPDCGRMIIGGGGVAFFEDGEHGLTDEMMTLGTHHVMGEFKNACQSRKWRWHRWKRDHLGIGWLSRKFSVYASRHKWFRPVDRWFTKYILFGLQ